VEEAAAPSEEPATAVAEEVAAGTPEKPQIRFAEEVPIVASGRGQPKGKRAKSRKATARKELKPEGKVKKVRKARRPILEEELEEEDIEQVEQVPD
jgi:hypothetical protein